jgi:hypothetical protein
MGYYIWHYHYKSKIHVATPVQLLHIYISVLHVFRRRSEVRQGFATITEAHLFYLIWDLPNGWRVKGWIIKVRAWQCILDIQGLQSDWPLLPLDLTVANSAPGHYSRYWPYFEHSSIKSFCQAYQADSFDPWSQTTISDNGVCSSEGTARAPYTSQQWKSPTPDILAWGLFTSGSSRAVIGHLSSGGEGSRFS